MGLQTSKLEKSLGEGTPQDCERYFGLDNQNNVCYCNSVLQALYNAKPFREAVMKHYSAATNKAEPSLLMALGELFSYIHFQKKRLGVTSARRFIGALKRENELFNNTHHQDAHEFLNYLLNEVSDGLAKEWKAANPEAVRAGTQHQSFVQRIFEGKLISETKCLCCENITTRDESFFDLSLDVEQNSSITAWYASSHTNLLTLAQLA
jgi:ubiquitin carboxyl-terminal hydrolase 12/46